MGAENLIGGVGGLALGLYQGNQANKAKKEANNQINAWEGQANDILAQAQNNANSYINSLKTISGDNALQQYQQLRDSFNPANYIYNAEQFDKSKYNVNDYLNEDAEQLRQDAMLDVQSTAAGSGLGHSSGALQSMVDAGIAKNEQLQNDAYNKMITERNFDYGQYTDYINQQQQKLNQLASLTQNQMSNLRGDLEFDQNVNAQKYNVQNDLAQSKLGLGNSLAQARASLV